MDVIEAVQQANPEGEVIMLTGYGNITTAVEAVKERRLIISPSQQMLMRLKQLLLQMVRPNQNHPKTLCLLTGSVGSIFNAYMNFVIEMFLRQRDD